MTMEKYDLEWWTALKVACEALGKLDSLPGLDALTADVFQDTEDLDVFHTTLMWFNHAEAVDVN